MTTTLQEAIPTTPQQKSKEKTKQENEATPAPTRQNLTKASEKIIEQTEVASPKTPRAGRGI